MSINPKKIETCLAANWPGPKIIHLLIESPDNVHFNCLIVLEDFNKLNKIKIHKLVYQALGNLMQEIHALAIKALTKEEYEKNYV